MALRIDCLNSLCVRQAWCLQADFGPMCTILEITIGRVGVKLLKVKAIALVRRAVKLVENLVFEHRFSKETFYLEFQSIYLGRL